jgi:hypothetical protein
VVLDDTVVDDSDIARDVRVCVGLARPAVRCPAGVADTHRAVELLAFEGAREIVELTDAPNDLQAAGRLNGEACRVVPPVFEFP